MGSVYAEDFDQTMDFNRISFSIIDGSFGSFIIRTFATGRGYRGNITVDPDIELNYESARTQYNLKVEATDLGQKTAVVAVVVNVVDVNDERPEFVPTEPVTVKENTTITESIGKFTAIDKDTNNSLIYELVSVKCRCNGSLTPCNWFILDPSGEVRVNPEAKIDYEQCTQGVVEAQVVDVETEKGENNSVSTGQHGVVHTWRSIRESHTSVTKCGSLIFCVHFRTNGHQHRRHQRQCSRIHLLRLCVW